MTEDDVIAKLKEVGAFRSLPYTQPNSPIVARH